MPGPRSAANAGVDLTDEDVLASIYQWTKQGLRMQQIALKLGYQPESFRGLLQHEDGTRARAIIDEARFDAQDELTLKLWQVALNDDRKDQLKAIQILLQRHGWGKDEAEQEAEKIQGSAKTPDEIRSRLRVVRDAQRAG